MLESLFKMRGVTPSRSEENIPINNQSTLNLPIKEGSMTNTTADTNNPTFFIYLSISVISMIIVTGVTGKTTIFAY